MPPENPPINPDPPTATHPGSTSAPEINANGTPDADAVARFLMEHPSFLEDHPELLSSMQLSHQSGARTVSLMERQVDVLRQRYKALELRLADLLRHGEENDAITSRLHQWTRPLLLVRDPAELPDRITQGLHERFAVPRWPCGSGALVHSERLERPERLEQPPQTYQPTTGLNRSMHRFKRGPMQIGRRTADPVPIRARPPGSRIAALRRVRWR